MTSRLVNGRYEVLRLHQRGGMAEVFLAHDLLLDRSIALKVLTPGLATDAKSIQRFQREARSAAGLDHPNIVSVYDYGNEGASYFIAMEFVEGPNLAEIIKSDSPIPALRAARIGRDVAAALDFAHGQGLVHRDIKPANVIVGQVVKVTDFGIALAVNRPARLTATGYIAGTAAYFSPEQARNEPLDARTDVYSLGVVLYEMVTGVLPFAADNPIVVAHQHAYETAPSPRSRNRSVPVEMEAIILKAMAKDLANRYPSAAALRADLLRFEQGRSVTAPIPVPPGWGPTRPGGSTTVETFKRTPHRSFGRSFATVLLLALIAVAVIVWRPWEGLNVPGRSSTGTTVAEVAVGGAVATTAATSATPVTTAATTTRPPTTLAPTTSTTRAATTTTVAGGAWPTRANDGSPALYAYMGADFEFPDWVSCADNFCIAGFGRNVSIYRQSPLSKVKTVSQTSAPTPLEVLIAAGFTEQTALRLLKVT